MTMTPKAEELYIAWINYRGSNKLIAYGELEGDEPEEFIEWYIEKRAYEMYIQEVEEVKKKYESTYYIIGVLSKRNYP